MTPNGITAGPDGNMWFANTGASTIGRMSTSGMMTMFSGEGIDNPQMITAGPDGNLWFTNQANNSIGRITPAGTVSNFTDASISGPYGITAGPDGNLWFTNQANNSIGRITPAGTVSNFTDASISGPYEITAGPDGNLWFTNQANNSIGRITPAGSTAQFSHPDISGPAGITVGPDGNVWITSSTLVAKVTPAGVITPIAGTSFASGIAGGPDGNLWTTAMQRITPSGGVSTAHGIGGGGWPRGITAGPDGNLWLTHNWGIYRMTTDLVVSSFRLSRPTAMTGGPDGAVWFVDQLGNTIDRLAPTGEVSVFAGPGVNGPNALTAGPDGALWFTTSGTDPSGNPVSSIGRITPTGTITTFTSPSVSQPDSITAGPGGVLWFANNGNNTIGRVTTAGTISAFGGATVNGPNSITAGPDGNLWFTNHTTNSIGCMTPTGVVSNFTDPSVAGPAEILAGPDGRLWFVNLHQSIGRVTTSGVISVVANSATTTPSVLAAGPDGNVWFANASNQVGRITPAGFVTSFATPALGDPGGITAGPDGNVWLTAGGDTTIRRVTPAGSITSHTGLPFDSPAGIASGPDGKLWFSRNRREVGRVGPPGAQDPAIDVGQGVLGLVAGPDANMWFTSFQVVGGTPVVGRITAAGVVTTFTDAGLNSPTDLTPAPDGSMWFINGPDSMGRVTTDGVISTFPVIGVRAAQSLTLGPDGNMWFISAIGTGWIVRVNPDHSTAAYSFTGVDAGGSLASGPDGKLWITGATGVATISPTGVITTPAGLYLPGAGPIVAGPDGNMWVATRGYGAPGTIDRITPAGTVTTYTEPGIIRPTSMVVGPDGDLWITDDIYNGSDSIERVGTGFSGGVPGAPSAVTAALAGPGQATVTWTPPTTNGGAQISRYQVTSTPGGHACIQVLDVPSCTVTGLTNGTAYQFTVTAHNALGDGPPAPPSAPVTPVAPPDAPTGITATAGKGQVTVAWTAPASDGGTPITVYTATANPGGKACTWSTGPLSCVINGLTDGTSYTFTVTAHNNAGDGPPSLPSAPTVAGLPEREFTPIVPRRLMDTRADAAYHIGPQHRFGPDETQQLVVAGGTTTIPADASAVVINLTVVGPTDASHVDVWPTGASQPNVSNVNFRPGDTVPNLAKVKVGADGDISLFNRNGSVDVIVDIVGYYREDPAAARFTPIIPNRIEDTRSDPAYHIGSQHRLGNSSDQRNLTVAGTGGVPADAVAVIANVTAVSPDANSHLDLWPAGTPRPNVSNLNFGPGQVVPNLAVVKVGAADQIAMANQNGSVDVIVDIVGYFTIDPNAAGFVATIPSRLIDTRADPAYHIGTHYTLSGAGDPRVITVTGGSIPADAKAIVANVTVVNPTAYSHLDVWPAGTPHPDISNLNDTPGLIVSNLVTVKIGSNGCIDVRNQNGTVDVIIDVVGYYR